jgi:hypothetical protein
MKEAIKALGVARDQKRLFLESLALPVLCSGPRRVSTKVFQLYQSSKIAWK